MSALAPIVITGVIQEKKEGVTYLPLIHVRGQMVAVVIGRRRVLIKADRRMVRTPIPKDKIKMVKLSCMEVLNPEETVSYFVILLMDAMESCHTHHHPEDLDPAGPFEVSQIHTREEVRLLLHVYQK
jgi:hypothetical protein